MSAARLHISAAQRAEIKQASGVGRINHDECPAGTDRKRRLFYAETPGGHYLHCWHCGAEGWLSRRLYGRAALDALEAVPTQRTTDAPCVNREALAEWSGLRDLYGLPARGGTVEMAEWAGKKGLGTDELRRALRVRLLGDVAELCVPIYRGDPARIVGYQGRQFGPGARKYPKYLTQRWEQSDHEMPTPLGAHTQTPWGTQWRAPRIVDAPLFIVESFADAAYLANLGYTAAALYGNDLSEAALGKLARHSCAQRGVVVWLDNDRQDIVEKAQRIAQRFALYVPAYCWIDLKAPTDTSATTIAGMLAGYARNIR